MWVIKFKILFTPNDILNFALLIIIVLFQVKLCVWCPGTQKFFCLWMSTRQETRHKGTRCACFRSFVCADAIRSRCWGFRVRFWLETSQMASVIGLAHSKDLTCAPRVSLAFGFALCLFVSEKTSKFQSMWLHNVGY